MARNVELGDCCRTVYLPTLADLEAWLDSKAEQYPAMGYYRIDTDLIEQREDEDWECEWIVGPSIEAVVAKMLEYLGVDTRVEWTLPLYPDSPQEGAWELMGLHESTNELKEAAVCAAIAGAMWTADEARARMLRSISDGAQDVLRVVSVLEVAEFLADEYLERDQGAEVYYGSWNEQRQRKLED